MERGSTTQGIVVLYEGVKFERKMAKNKLLSDRVMSTLIENVKHLGLQGNITLIQIHRTWWFILKISKI